MTRLDTGHQAPRGVVLPGLGSVDMTVDTERPTCTQ